MLRRGRRRLYWAIVAGAACLGLLLLVIPLDAATAGRPAATVGHGGAGRPRALCTSREPFNPPLVASLAASGVLALDTRRGLASVVSSTDAAHATLVQVATFDATTGSALRARHLTTSPVVAAAAPVVLGDTTSVALDAVTGRLFVLHEPFGQGTAPPGRVDVLDERTLALLRGVPVDGLALPPVVDEATGRVFIAGRQGGVVSVLDARTGQALRTTRMPGGAPAAALVDERTGRVFVAADAVTGLVGVLDARTGTLLRRVVVGANPRALALDPVNGLVLVANHGSASVSVLDARSGAMLRTIALPASPSAIIASGTTRRAFVSYDDSLRVSVLDTARGTVVRSLPVRLDFDTLHTHRTPLPQQPGTVPPPVADRVDDVRRWAVVRLPEIVDDDGVEPYSAQITILDSRTGTRLNTIPAQDTWPEAAAVDDTRGRAFVQSGDRIDMYDISCLKSYYILGDLG